MRLGQHVVSGRVDARAVEIDPKLHSLGRGVSRAAVQIENESAVINVFDKYWLPVVVFVVILSDVGDRNVVAVVINRRYQRVVQSRDNGRRWSCCDILNSCTCK